MSSTHTRSERPSSRLSEVPGPDEALDEPRDDSVRAHDSKFAELLSEVARAPALSPAYQLPGGTRAGEHVIIAPIGRGAFGTVYRALHPVLGSEVAIKVLSSVHATDPAIARRFVEEARVIHRVRHPHIVELLGFGELSNGQLYYAMELLTGSTLTAQIEARGALAPSLALAVLAQIADALDAAHAHGVLHRDLKPDNIFVVGALTPDCKVKLLDFGIAKLLGDDTEQRTRSGMLMGSPGYMSPEQCGAEAVDAKSDIYALGVIAHELLTGRRVFPGTTARELMAQHMFNAAPRASEVESSLPPQLDAPLLAMLEKQPARRPASATAAVQALSDALARAAGEPRPVHRRRRAGLRWAFLAAGLLGVLWYVQSTARAPVPAPSPAAASSTSAEQVAPTPGSAPMPPSGRPLVEHVSSPASSSATSPIAVQPKPDERATRRSRPANAPAKSATPKRTRGELQF